MSLAVAVPSPLSVSIHLPPACNVTIHNRCKDTLPNCTKVKQKVSTHLAVTSETSWPVSAAPDFFWGWGRREHGDGDTRHDASTPSPSNRKPRC